MTVVSAPLQARNSPLALPLNQLFYGLRQSTPCLPRSGVSSTRSSPLRSRFLPSANSASPHSPSLPSSSASGHNRSSPCCVDFSKSAKALHTGYRPPISPPFGPTQWLFQRPPAESKFPAVTPPHSPSEIHHHIAGDSPERRDCLDYLRIPKRQISAWKSVGARGLVFS